VNVTYSGTWSASPNPIRIGHPNIIVTWNIAQVLNPMYWGGQTVKNVKVKFYCGQTGFDPDKGPFVNVTTWALSSPPPPPILEGFDQAPPTSTFPIPYGDCYRYNFLVTLSNGEAVELFLIDPQIDNLAPPPVGDPGE